MFARQFLLSTHAGSKPENFRTRNVGTWYLHYCPELPVAIYEAKILIGHAVDWSNPELSNEDILANMPSCHNRLAGRWAYLDLSENGEVFSDGSMTVCHTGSAVASSAALLASVDPSLERKAHAGLHHYKKASRHSGLAFLATDTGYCGAHSLLTNHKLRLADFSVERFGPDSPSALSKTEAIPKIAEILTGIMYGLVHRSKIALALTGGYDSRLLAAALSQVPEARDRAITFTIQDRYATGPGHYDIELARWIATVVGFEHHTLYADASLDTRWRNQIRGSEDMQAPRFEEWAKLSSEDPLVDRLILNGWVSPVGRAYYSWPGSENVDVEDVLNVCHIEGPEREDLREEAKRWLEGARDATQQSGVPVSDLLYWELRVPRWVGSCCTILGFGGFWMAPYSCRDLLMTMIGIPEDERGKSGHPLYVELIRHMRPELLERPINPKTFSQRVKAFIAIGAKHRLAKLLVYLGLYDTMRRLRRN